MGAPALSVVADLDPEDVRRSLEQIQRRTRTGVPDRISLKVTTIATTINELLPRADALGAGSPGRHVLVNCATDYLPTALQAYLDRPRSYAHHHVVIDGKTPLDLLAEQLGVLAEQVDEIAENVNRANSDKLIANGLFLAEKFGRGPLDIDRAAAVSDVIDRHVERADPSSTSSRETRRLDQRNQSARRRRAGSGPASYREHASSGSSSRR